MFELLLRIEAVAKRGLFGDLAAGMYLEELHHVQQVQLVSWCAGDQCVAYLMF